MSLSQVLSEDSIFRWDSEFFRKETLSAKKAIEAHTHKSLQHLVARIQHPVEVKRIYVESGLRILLAQEVRNNELSLGNGMFMTSGIEPLIKTNKLTSNDVVLTRSGANYGQCAPIKTSETLYACADLLVLRKLKLPNGYISTFLNTKQGRLLLDRGAYGAAQPHIAPTYVNTILVPIFEKLPARIDAIVKAAEDQKQQAHHFQKKSEQTLLRALGLENWQAPESLSYTRKASDAFKADRLDAEHFQPKYYAAQRALLGAGALHCISIEEVLVSLTNGHTPLRHDLSMGSVSFLCAEHVSDFELSYNSQKHILASHHQRELARTAVKNGDILLTIKGRVGNAAIAETVPGDVNINQDVALLRFNPKLPHWYIIAFLNSRFGKLQTQQMCTGAINPFLGLFSIRRFMIPVFETEKMDFIAEQTKTYVHRARQARNQGKALLESAKHAVEIAIEQNEKAALEYLESQKITMN